MKRPGLVRREWQLLQAVPDVLTYKSVLYIGARPSRMQLLDLFLTAGYWVEILEAFEPNVAALKEINHTRRIFNDLYLGDVRCIRDMSSIGTADVVVWWHGPEHVTKVELPPTLQALEERARKLVILGCPFGAVAQGVSYGNAFEVHAAALYPADFEALGYQTSTIGSPDKGGSNILSWKRIVA